MAPRKKKSKSKTKYTAGFGHPLDLKSHYGDHVLAKGEFPHITSEKQYLQEADKFLGGPKDATTKEGKRWNKSGTDYDVIRYNTATQEYGILSSGNVIRSYYKPDPSVHGFKSNLDYFKWDCKTKRK